MREVQIVVSCDACRSEGSNGVPSEYSTSLTIDAMPSVEIDLCDRHRDEYLPILEALHAMGHRPVEDDQPLKLDGDRPVCPICHRDYSGRLGLRQHMLRMHDVSITEYEEENSLICPECGFRTVDARGLGAHRSRKHGILGTSVAAIANRKAKAS